MRALNQYKIGIVSLSSPSSTCEDKIHHGIQVLKDLNLKITIGSTVFCSLGNKSASAEDRDLHNMFLDTSVDLILNTTGGFCSNDLLDLLDFDLLRNNNKIFVGYSDISSVNLAAYTLAETKTISGPMLVGFLDCPQALSLLFLVLSQETFALTCPSQIWENGGANRRETPTLKYLANKNTMAQGSIIASNLSTFVLLAGTRYFPNLKGSILFLEYDKEEEHALPSLERMLVQVRQTGAFTNINGLVFGLLEAASAREETEIDNIETILERVSFGYRFPVLYDAPFGHTFPSWILPMGASVSIDTSTGSPKLRVEQK
ncbi:MAG: LD-carboxypeptidase [SAR324 cluster bacterium]|uniref:LD-carboxypeptidase n=1 Tax=SAR324 cluster bacterium TaxID=2024889 RepID=A0A7X9IJ62_9DELT|nr:LD-carboxypeptidase [SAR324 cluster bacterium]